MLTLSKNKTIKRLLFVGAIFFIALLVSVAIYYSFTKIYKNKFYPGVYIADINMGGKTLNEAQELLGEKEKKIEKNGITFSYNNNEAVVTPVFSSFEIDLAQQVITFDLKKSLEEAITYGKNKNIFQNIFEIAGNIFSPKNFPVYYTINENPIKKSLEDKFNEFEIKAQDASLATSTVSLLDSKEISFSIQEEKYGKIVDYNNGINKLKKQLASLNDSKIILTSKTDYPKIYKKDCLNIEANAQKIVNNAPLTLKYEDQTWLLDKNKIANLLLLESSEDGKIYVALGKEKVKKYLEDYVSPKIDKKPIDAKFEIKSGRVTEFQNGVDGLGLNIASSTELINEEFIQHTKNEINLIVDETKSEIGINEVNTMGINEIIGTGYSNFAGSPANRRHNISVGSNAIEGRLIAPDEEFSLVTALGKIDASTGYLPELVIKGNETIPEYGGGLCQVGTTLFRTALAAGLKITARRNHSYRVSYYEPAGTDAAVYDPWPDVKFINDTDNYILIQTRIEGNSLYYDFWGTKDGREATTTYPVVYNITKPEPTKLIETLSLAPGEKKCTEHAHNGADAYFDYIVNYIDKETKERRFYSHYTPWQEVCLIGVEQLSEKQEENNSDNFKKESEGNTDLEDSKKIN